MLENKEFRVKEYYEYAKPLEGDIELINKRYPWHEFWFDKDQLDALIEILTQLKEKIDGNRNPGSI